MLGSRGNSSAVMQQQSGIYAAPLRRLYRTKARPKTTSELTPYPSCQQSRGWNLSQLVVARQAYQTKRAANGIKTRASPKDSVTTSDQPQEQTDRRRLRAQMTDLIRRTGIGLERDVRWKSGTAPGTGSLADVSALTGNSANAEVVAKERVNKVRCLNLLKDL